MVSIEAENLSLVYRIRSKRLPSLAGRTTSSDVGGAVAGGGRQRVVTALDGVSFALQPSDRLGLIGRNGSGKTTLLKVLHGIFEPTGGLLTVQGRVDALFNINLGFRQQATGRRNILLRGLINGWSEAQIADRIEQIIAFSELREFIDMPFKSYSQGMAARLAFSTAMALEPEILLMDEWIGAGDASFQTKAKTKLAELAERAGIIVLASHNHELLKRTCNKFLKLRQGRVVLFTSNAEEATREDSAD